MLSFATPNRHGYSVKFSPFDPNLLVCATSQFYGLSGGGTLFLFEINLGGSMKEISCFQWSDGLFDVVWSEANANIVVTASGDGVIQLWNLSQETPVGTLKEHKKEVYSVDWTQTRQENLILSASWDCSVKIWDPNYRQSLSTFLGHSKLVYSAMWSPLIPSCFASVSGDGSLRIWNAAGGNPVTISAHDAEVLSCSWSRYDSNLLATAASDGLIRFWDLRYLSLPSCELAGSEFAVRRIQFSPHRAAGLASVSYDFSTKIWDVKVNSNQPLESLLHHSEFVYGLDFSNHSEGLIADCGWDSLINVFHSKALIS